MSDEIRPALTAEEWKRALRGENVLRSSLSHDDGKAWVNSFEYGYDGQDAHALAALCLYGQPFGFDKAEVEWLRTRCNKSEDVDVVGMRILSKIEALLPPSP